MREMKVYEVRAYERYGWLDRLRLTLARSKKRAFKEDGPLDRVSLEMQIRRRDFGLAMLLGNGLMVVDKDGPRQGPFSHLTSPMTAMGNRGPHLYMRHEIEGATNKIKAGGCDVDLLFNGIAGLPPSEMATGKVREWKNGIVRFEELPVFPRELYERILRKPETRGEISSASVVTGNRYVEAALRSEARRVASAQEGTRNATLNRAAFSLGSLVAAGMLSRDAVEVALTEAALSAGLGEKEIVATLKSGITAGLKRPRKGIG